MKKTTLNANEKMKAGAKVLIVSPFLFDDAAGDAGSGVAIPSTIHLIPIGTWQHDLYGPIMINSADRREFKLNFEAKIRKGVYITAGHEGFEELPAVGWFTSVEVRDDGLWGNVEWNSGGKELLSDKAYKFLSPEFCRDYEDPQTHAIYRNVLIGGALTKSPYFKRLEAIVFSDKKTREQFSNNDVTMNLQDLLAKKIEELTDEEKAFVKTIVAELTEEQEAEFTAILDEVAEPAADPAPADPASVEDPAQATDPAAATDPVAASEKGNVTISASELAILREQANKGQQAFAELGRQEIETSVKKLVFSKGNEAGKFLPKSMDKLRVFMKGLTKAQRTAFSTLIAQLPAQVFSELGTTGAPEGTGLAEVGAKVDAKLAANPKMTYSDAVKEVMAENKGLEEHYDSELTPVRGAK